MTFPVYFHFGAFSISAHLLFDLLAYYGGFLYYSFLHKKRGFLSEDQRFFILLSAAIGSLFGSRILGSLENPYLFFHPPTLFYYYASSTVVGGILGGIIGVEIGKWCMGIKKSTGDLLTFPIIVALIVGRIGCLLTGVVDGTVGNPSSLPWAFNQGDGIPRHPTSLYEILFLICLFFVLRTIQKKTVLFDGVLFRLFIIFYLTFRFFIEFIKPTHPLVFGISAIGVASFLGIVSYAVALLSRYKKIWYRRGIV